jgi:hypothetical protein
MTANKDNKGNPNTIKKNRAKTLAVPSSGEIIYTVSHLIQVCPFS